MKQVLYETVDRAAYITINAIQHHNVLNAEILEGLRCSVDKAAKDSEIRVIVLSAAGNEYFSAGGDLGETMRAAARKPEVGFRTRLRQDRLLEDLQLCGKPTVARVSGPALGAGFGLALACDFIFATGNVYFSLPEVFVGLWPHSITVPLLRSISSRRALELILTGERLGVEEASRLGIVYEVVSHEDIDKSIHALAKRLYTGSPQAIALGRTAFYRALGGSNALHSAVGEQALIATLGSAEAQEGTLAFSEKRKPSWGNSE